MPNLNVFANNIASSYTSCFGDDLATYRENVAKVAGEPKFTAPELTAVMKRVANEYQCEGKIKLTAVKSSEKAEKLALSQQTYRKILNQFGDIRLSQHKPFPRADAEARRAQILFMKPGDSPEVRAENDRTVDLLFSNQADHPDRLPYADLIDRFLATDPAKILIGAYESENPDRYIAEHAEEIGLINAINCDAEKYNGRMMSVISRLDEFGPEVRDKVERFQDGLTQLLGYGQAFTALNMRLGIIANPMYASVDVSGTGFYKSAHVTGQTYVDVIAPPDGSNPELGPSWSMTGDFLASADMQVDQVFAGEELAAEKMFKGKGINPEELTMTYKDDKGRTVTEPFSKSKAKDLFWRLDGSAVTLSDKEGKLSVDIRADLKPHLMLKMAKAAAGELDVRPEKPKRPPLWHRVAHFFVGSAYKAEFDAYEKNLEAYGNFDRDREMTGAFRQGAKKGFEEEKQTYEAGKRAEREAAEKKAAEMQKAAEAREKNRAAYDSRDAAIEKLRQPDLPLEEKRRALGTILTFEVAKELRMPQEIFDQAVEKAMREPCVRNMSEGDVEEWASRFAHTAKPDEAGHRFVRFINDSRGPVAHAQTQAGATAQAGAQSQQKQVSGPVAG